MSLTAVNFEKFVLKISHDAVCTDLSCVHCLVVIRGVNASIRIGDQCVSSFF